MSTCMDKRGSSIHSLPLEILSKIFLTCVANDGPKKTSISHDPMKISHAPWVLTQICRDWRQLVIADSILWSTFAIFLNRPLRPPSTWISSNGDTKYKPCDPPPHIVSAFLTRSGSHPLSISLHLHGNDAYWEQELPPGTPNTPRDVVGLIHEQTFRVRSLSVHIPPQLQILESSFPPLIAPDNLLETLHLRHLPLISPNTSFRHLRRFGWTGGLDKVFEMPIPWSQLSDLSLESEVFVHFATLRRVLMKTAMTVSSLSLTIVKNCSECTTCNYAEERVHLPDLDSLEIAGPTEGTVTTLAAISAPNIKSLCYAPNSSSMTLADEADLYKAFKAFHLQHLESFVLRSSYFPLRPFQPILESSPSLVHLGVLGLSPNAQDRLLTLLTVGEGTSLCPNLSSFSLWNDALTSANPGVLASMVESRVAIGRPLVELDVSMRGKVFEKDHPRLQKLNNDGKLRLLYWKQRPVDNSWLHMRFNSLTLGGQSVIYPQPQA